MEVIKKLGNNAAICRDHSGRELIAIGLGIGFPKCPYILDDLSKIDRTFYNVDAEYLSLKILIQKSFVFLPMLLIWQLPCSVFP